MRLAHPNDEKERYILTDASDSHWAAVVSQCEPEELDKPFENQKHYPLAFLSSAFKNSELRWSTFEKEAYAILQVFKKICLLYTSDAAAIA